MTRGKRLLAVVAAAAAVAAASVLAMGTANAESNGGVKVMPLGDSITDGLTVAGGYRINLWQKLVADGYKVDFVGSMFNGPSSLGDHDHEGHSGWTIAQVDANIVNWLQTYQPRTVLLHIGTNDIYGSNPGGAPARLGTLLDHITATAPDTEVFVAQITPLSCCDATVRTFNAAIPGLVQSRVNAGKHLHLVNMYSALTTGDLADGVHPNAGGYAKMATVWYNALRSVPGSLTDGAPPSSPPPSSPPPSSPSPSVPPSGSCTASMVSGTVFGDRYNTTVNVSGSTNWTVTVTLTAPQRVSSTWSGTFSWSGGGYVMTVRPNGSGNSFGFTTMFNGNSSARPRVSCRVG